MKKSKVVSVTPNGTWESKFVNEQTGSNIRYKFEIEMENGDAGEYSSIYKDQTKFVQGEECEYEFTGGDWPKIKPVSTFKPRANYSSSNSDVQDNIRFAQGLNIANLQYCHGKINENQIDDVANEMYEKLKNHGKSENLTF